MYEQWLRERGQLGISQGPSGPNNGGLGMGQRPDPDESVTTGFTPEKSNSQLQAGKLLLQWKTKEVSDSGQAREEYLKQVQQVKQGVSEAIQQEQVPPGYHEGIKKYFDSLAESAPKTDSH